MTSKTPHLDKDLAELDAQLEQRRSNREFWRLDDMPGNYDEAARMRTRVREVALTHGLARVAEGKLAPIEFNRIRR
jgi:hypothetical protein